MLLAGIAQAADTSPFARWNTSLWYTATDNPYVCEPFTVQLGNSPGQTTNGLLFIGFREANVPIAGSGTILVEPSFTLLLSIPPGGLSLTQTLPCDNSVCGLEVYLQALQLDGNAVGGLSFTQGLKAVFGTR